jgi:PAT family beta-lactamase induction signal transducer AmpG
LQVTLALFFLAGFASATNDIATDGYYMLGMSPDQQAFYVGIRSTFYRIATITGNGLLVVMAGYLNKDFGYQLPQAWSITLVVLAAILAVLALVHQWKLPRVEQVQKDSQATLSKELSDTLFTFFQKPGIGISILFLLLYRLGEAQLVKIAPLFLKDTLENGGLGLDNKAFGLIYGTLGILALVLGGILGGILLSRTGLGRWVWTMLLLLNVPHFLYVYIALAQVTSLWAIGATVIVEQFCYGFSFTFLGVFTLWLAQGKHKTAHYAFATALWAFSMMIPGSIAGKVQGMLGYPMFFLFITLCGIPAFLVAAFLRYDPLFGKKQEN